MATARKTAGLSRSIGVALAASMTAARATLTYNGDQDVIEYKGYTLPRGEAVEVDQATAKRLANNPYFEVTGLPDENPAPTSPDEALEAERARHAEELAAVKADFAKQTEETIASLKAGWEEQHKADQDEIARLNGLLTNPAPAAPEK
jgi:hypothetical protein